MDHRTDLLLRSAARLYSLGVELEGARARVKDLVDQGIAYDSEEMVKAAKDFAELDAQWKALEQQHLELRAELLEDAPEPHA